MTIIAGPGSETVSVSQKYGSMDPDPYQNVALFSTSQLLEIKGGGNESVAVDM
jgi:hypothetical protein